MDVDVNINTFCADYTIEPLVIQDDPTPYFYRRFVPETNQIFYLYVADVYNSGIGYSGFSVGEVESPMNRNIFSDAGDSDILPQFFIRLYSSSKNTLPLGNKIITKKNIVRLGTNPYARLALISDDKQTIQMAKSPSAINDPPWLLSIDSFESLGYEGYDYEPVTYTRTTIPPAFIEPGMMLMYLVRSSDNDTPAVITKDTPMRFATLKQDDTTTFYELDLFTPSITENMIKLTVFRMNRITILQTTPQSPVVHQYSLDVFGRSSLDSLAVAAPTDQSFDWRLLNLEQISSLGSITFDTVNGNPSNGFMLSKIRLANGNQYTLIPNVFDKSVAELFGDFSLGLFKLFHNNMETNMYLGYDCYALNTGGTCTATGKRLVNRDYFIYRSPESCQIHMYEIGSNQFILSFLDIDTNTRRYLRVNNNGVITWSSTLPTKNETGWSIIPVDMSKNIVRLAWNYPGELANPPNIRFLSVINKSANSVDAPTLVANPASSNTYVCYKCSLIDPVTGACANNRYTYIDHDNSQSTTQILSSPIPINRARVSPGLIKQGITIISSSDGLKLQVSDNGTMSFNGASTDKFFFTQDGMTQTERVNDIYFIGKRLTANRGYLYAKWTPSNLTEFVFATVPNVDDGFGWKIMASDTNIVPSKSDGTLPSNTSTRTFFSTYQTYRIVYGLEVDPITSYNATSNTWTIPVKYTSGKISSTTRVEYRLSTSVGGAFTTAIRDTTPLNPDVERSGSFTILAPQTTPVTYTLQALTSANEILGPINFTVPVYPAPTITSIPFTVQTEPSPLIIFNNAVISNMATGTTTPASPITITVGALAPVTTSYSVLTGSTGVTIGPTGLSGGTNYNAVVACSNRGNITSMTIPISIPAYPQPVVTRRPIIEVGAGFTSVRLYGAGISNMLTGTTTPASPITITVGALAPVTTSYSVLTGSTGVTISGLAVNTNYNMTIVYSNRGSTFTDTQSFSTNIPFSHRITSTTSNIFVLSNVLVSTGTTHYIRMGSTSAPDTATRLTTTTVLGEASKFVYDTANKGIRLYSYYNLSNSGGPAHIKPATGVANYISTNSTDSYLYLKVRDSTCVKNIVTSTTQPNNRICLTEQDGTPIVLNQNQLQLLSSTAPGAMPTNFYPTIFSAQEIMTGDLSKTSFWLKEGSSFYLRLETASATSVINLYSSPYTGTVVPTRIMGTSTNNKNHPTIIKLLRENSATPGFGYLRVVMIGTTGLGATKYYLNIADGTNTNLVAEGTVVLSSSIDTNRQAAFDWSFIPVGTTDGRVRLQTRTGRNSFVWSGSRLVGNTTGTPLNLDIEV